MLANKHVVAALIIAPILAVLTYFAVDSLVSEKPHVAVKGASYKLIARSNCRYASGRCDLENGNFKVSAILRETNDSLLLELNTEFPIDGAKASIVSSHDIDSAPIELKAVKGDRQHWRAQFNQRNAADSILRIAIAAQDSLYFGETVALFANLKSTDSGD